MPYLWTWYDNFGLKIPNTNNALEGKFSDLKVNCATIMGCLKRIEWYLLTNILGLLFYEQLRSVIITFVY